MNAQRGESDLFDAPAALKRALKACGLALLSLILLCSAWPGTPAHAATGIIGLDEDSIPVKAPAKVYLDTITRAGTRLVAAGEHGVIVYSDDDGAAWRQATVPVDATLTDIVFTSPNNGWAVGNSGVVLHSADAGVTWQLKLDGLRANQLTLVAARQAIAAHSTAVAVPNALRRAKFFMDQGADKPFFSVLVLNQKTIIVFGAYRMVMRSDDAGATWQDSSLTIADPVSHNLYQALRVGGAIYLAGENGLVFHSLDDATSFSAVTSPAPATLFGLFASSGGLFAYGVAGALFRTQDGGQSWQQIQIVTGADLTAAVTLQSGAILLASSSGVVFVSHNNGGSFQAMPGGLPMTLFDMVQAKNGDVIAVGNFGVMKIPRSSLG